jgi:hypothetical protein
MKIIYKAKDIIEAHIVRGMLVAQGIEAFVGGYYLQGGVGTLAASDFANVQVADEDAAAALPFITEYDEKAQDIKTGHHNSSKLVDILWPGTTTN